MVQPLAVSPFASPVGLLPSGSHSGFLLVTHVHPTPGPWHLPRTLFFALINSLLTPSSWFALHPKLYFLRGARADLSSQMALLLVVSQSPEHLYPSTSC